MTYISHSTLIYAINNLGLMSLIVIFKRFVEPPLGLIVHVTLSCPHIATENLNRNSVRKQQKKKFEIKNSNNLGKCTLMSSFNAGDINLEDI
jgi:hypothetical protein